VEVAAADADVTMLVELEIGTPSGRKYSSFLVD